MIMKVDNALRATFELFFFLVFGLLPYPLFIYACNYGGVSIIIIMSAKIPQIPHEAMVPCSVRVLICFFLFSSLL